MITIIYNQKSFLVKDYTARKLNLVEFQIINSFKEIQRIMQFDFCVQEFVIEPSILKSLKTLSSN